MKLTHPRSSLAKRFHCSGYITQHPIPECTQNRINCIFPSSRRIKLVSSVALTVSPKIKTSRASSKFREFHQKRTNRQFITYRCQQYFEIQRAIQPLALRLRMWRDDTDLSFVLYG